MLISDQLRKQLVYLREKAGMTRSELAAECARLGRPELTVNALGNIETGRPDKDGNTRREVTVDEWNTLAAALRVPPQTLLLALGRSANVQLFPHLNTPMDRALEWFTLGFTPEGLPEVTTADRQTLIRVKTHAEFVAGYLDSLRDVQEEPGDWLDDHIEQGRTLIKGLREQMRRDGQIPPDLPPELVDLDRADEPLDPAEAERRLRLGDARIIEKAAGDE